MLDTLIESKNNSKNRMNRVGFMTVTTILMTALFSFVLVWSIFAKELNVGDEGLEFSSLIAPVPETQPPTPEPIQNREIKQAINSTAKAATRNAIISRIDETQAAPDKISTTSNIGKSRPENGNTVVIKPGIEDDGSITGDEKTREPRIGGNDSGPVEIKHPTKKPIEKETEDLAPVKKVVEKPAETPKPEPKKTLISLGVINGKAITLPVPSYPPTAKAVGASGDVSVQVLIDENGKVISANAISGHPLLRAEAVRAALKATFTATKLSNQPVKVSGFIIYKFAR